MLTRAKLGAYELLVNRVPEIQKRYQSYRAVSNDRARSWLYLMKLNFCHYVLGAGKKDSIEGGPKRLYIQESRLAYRREAWKLAEQLSKFDVITFDIFDTLILRPFSRPADLFFFVGMELSYLNFAQIREETEQEARRLKYARTGSCEVTFEEIWKLLSRRTGIDPKRGMEAEWKTELRFCTGNPYFRDVLKILRARGKTLAAASDMYYGRERLRTLLEKTGMGTFAEVFSSSQQGASKADGSLFPVIRKTFGEGKRYAHVGDSRRSDVEMGRRRGFRTFWYPNIQEKGNRFRPGDMSAITGSMYRGLVNLRLYGSRRVYPILYEFGYMYGGILILGYCRFIHDFARERRLDKILFLARDGEVVKAVYDRLYPGEDTAYVLWSRSAALKLSAGFDRQDFFRRFLYHKANQGYTLAEIFGSMDLSHLLKNFCLKTHRERDTVLDGRLADQCREYLTDCWDRVLEAYKPQREAAGIYFGELLKDCGRAAAVDVGWAGSGALALAALLDREWAMDCRLYALVAGTNTVHNREPDASQGFFYTGRMQSYLFSQQHNRDLWKFHNVNRDHNRYLELLFSSEERPFLGFYLKADKSPGFLFGPADTRPEEIRRIQRGILDFVRDWLRFFGKPTRGAISGRDAYEPVKCMLEDEAYLKKLRRRVYWKEDANV